MDSEEASLCHHCQVRPARHHFNIVEAGQIRSLPLCGQCFEFYQAGVTERAAVAVQHCSYCGAKASGRVSTIDQIIGGPGDRFGCERCHQEYHRFLLEHLDAMNAELMELDNATQMEALRHLYDETESHMEQWVRQRDN